MTEIRAICRCCFARLVLVKTSDKPADKDVIHDYCPNCGATSPVRY